MNFNIRRICLFLLIATSLNLFTSCNGGGKKSNESTAKDTPATLTVFAAASLTDVLSELVDTFEVKNKVSVTINMASSGTLARQIEQGGTPDIYISASKKWADYIDSLGFVIAPYKEVIAKNDLVLIAPKDSPLEPLIIDKELNILSLLGSNRLSMGDPSHVPAGRYARQSLDYFGWYKTLSEKMLPAKDVRSALMVVEMGEAPLGIVYRTDAQKSGNVKIIGTFPGDSHKPIVYVSAIITDSSLAEKFFKFLKTDEAKPIWNKYGFAN